MQVDKRNVVKIGGSSYGVILPRKWVRYHKIENSKVKVIEKGCKVIIKPIKAGGIK